MHIQQNLGQCEEYARRALGLMAEFKIAATPQNYTLWFNFALGDLKALNRAIEERLATGEPITQEDCTRLFDKYLSNKATEDAMIEIGDSVTQELNNVHDLLQTASRDTSSYGDTLEGVAGQLAKSNDAALIKVVIDNLATATRSMASRSKKLEEHLTLSKSEVVRLKEAIDAVREEARTDQLTSLSNRKAFDETFARAVAAALDGNEPMSLIMGDIDKFKTFNDTWGHQTGDQVLRLVAHCMKESVRQPPDLAARYGGEEFAVVLPGATLESASAVAERIRMSIESKRVMKRSTGEDLGRITMSLGVALYQPGEPPADLIKRADECLYAAKHAGRNRVVTELQLGPGAAAAKAKAASG